MDLDIVTDRVTMQPEWHRAIDLWVERCARIHPDVTAIELTLRHDGPERRPGEDVDVVATIPEGAVHAARHANLMDAALHDALDDLEHELLVHEAVRRRP